VTIACPASNENQGSEANTGSTGNTGETAAVVPKLTGFLPESQTEGGTVTLFGTDLSGAVSVIFGSGPDALITENSPTSITVIVPVGATSGAVFVKTHGGTTTLAGFTCVKAPQIIGFSPNAQGVDRTVIISGVNLENALSVSFGLGLNATIQANTRTAITALVPPGSTSGEISVTTPLGSTKMSGFTFVPAPVVTGFTATAQAVEFPVIITGSSLANATSVTFGGGPSATVISNSPTSIKAIVPAGSANGSVAVTTTGGTSTLAGFALLPSAWTSYSGVPALRWNDLTWSPSLSIFVAVASDGTKQVMSSIDGQSWDPRTTPGSVIAWESIVWSPERSLFVAVGFASVMTSPNGINWTLRSSPATNSWRSVTWSPELGLFAAVDGDGSPSGVMTSQDGLNWTLRTTPQQQWESIAWSPSLGLFTAVAGPAEPTQSVMTSPDGITWTERVAAENNAWNAVIWSPELSLFVAVASSGPHRVMTSPNGIDWTAHTAPLHAWRSIAWSSELRLFVVVGSLDHVMTSTNGVDWSAASSPLESLESVAWSPSLGRFVAVTSSGPQRVMTTQ
jgi:hypothetical protein